MILETTEVCPNCEAEVTLNWNTDNGYKTKCPECGKRLMLCDLCQHRDNVTDENGLVVGQSDCDYDWVSDTCRFNTNK